MKIHRFIGRFDLDQDMVACTEADFCRQVKNVLRLRPGELVTLAAGGREALCRLKSIAAGQIQCEVLDRAENQAEASGRSILYCALLKRENFELAAQKATECGIKKIVPLVTARTIKTGLKLARVEKIMREASEQCGRAQVPELSAVSSLAEAFKQAAEENETNIIFDRVGEKYRPEAKTSVGLFIGPEGGWTEEELNRARALGFRLASLGARTLRAETAAMIATFLTHYG